MMYRQNTIPFHKGSYQKQQGIATVLLVILVGLALTASGLAITHSIRSTQEKYVAVNAVTHAQTGVWAGADAFRRYLTGLTSGELLALSGNLDISMNSSYGNLSAKDIVVTDMGSNRYQVAANIINVHTTAKSSAALGIVYEITLPSGGSGPVELPAALNFYDDLEAMGAISFVAPASGSTEINVDGAFKAISIGLDNVSTIRATGAVELSSSVNVEKIYSNDDVTIKAGAWVDEVYTAGRVFSLSPGGGIGIIGANGNVVVQSGTASVIVKSRSDIEINAGSHGDFSAGGQITLGNGWAQNIEAVKDITITNSTAHTDSITSEGNLNCPTSNDMRLGDVSINGTLGGTCVLNTTNTTSVSTGASNSITVMDELAPISIPPLIIDVWKLKDDANFIFEYDTVTNKRLVTVKNINGIPDGQYKIGRYAGNAWAYICDDVDSSGICTGPTNRYIPVCLGQSEWMAESCINYNVATKTWKFDNNSGSMSNTAPGIMWFEGNVSINSGLSYTTYLATGDVVDNGIFKGVSVNLADYPEICEAAGGSMTVHHQYYDESISIIRSDYTSIYSGFYPTNLCDVDSGTYNSIPVGNIAIAAGGYNPDDGGTYSGGDITLGTTSRAWGTVLAGGYLHTGGSSSIYGYLNAAALNKDGTNSNELSGATSVDLSVITANYNPTMVPNMGSGASSGSSGSSSAQAQGKVLWARIL